jgi:hypothetical protein
MAVYRHGTLPRDRLFRKGTARPYNYHGWKRLFHGEHLSTVTLDQAYDLVRILTGHWSTSRRLLILTASQGEVLGAAG